MGNACANEGGASSEEGHGGSGGSHADGRTSDSPGVGSGNQIQVPVHVPVNVCGNSVDVVGAGNATEGNDCANGGPGHEEPGQPGTPERPDTPGDEPSTPATPGDTPRGNQPDTHPVTPPRADAQLAQTGSEVPMGLVLPVGAGALLAGAVLYRKARGAA
ncbi:chaplin family protein [Streptomyces toyocaensis]